MPVLRVDLDPGQRDQSVQLLRAIAAATVSFLHLAFAFSDHVGEGLGLARGDGQASQAAVALFFLISGYIMVVSSRGLFGTAGGTLRFWLRRVVRILPPYWIATGLLVAIFLWLGREVDGTYLLRSLLLVPDNGPDGARPLPLLWPGWTLLYEMLFYLAFGAGISFGRKAAVMAATGAVLALVMAGFLFDPAGAVLFSLTRPVSLLFLGGMALALWRERGFTVPGWLRLLAGSGSVAAMLWMEPPQLIDALDLGYVVWAGTPALLFFLAVVGGPLRVPFPRLSELMGGSSYALYLLHLPVAWLWVAFYPGFLFRFGPWFYLATLVVAAFLAAIAFYLLVERPMTRALNARLSLRLLEPGDPHAK